MSRGLGDVYKRQISFSGMTLGSVFRYIFSIVMARFLGAQMLGIYSLGNAVTRIAEIFALMGLDNGVLRFVSRDTENSQNVNNSIYSSLKAGLLSSIVISIILFFRPTNCFMLFCWCNSFYDMWLGRNDIGMYC